MKDYGVFAPSIEQLEQWTCEEATQAGRDWVKENGVASSDNPTSQWIAWHGDLPRLKTQYESGDSKSLLKAIEICAVRGLPMPSWCRDAYLRSCRKVERYEVRTLDEAFSHSMKGVNLDRAKQRHRYSLITSVEVAKHYSAGETIENAFQAVSEKYPLSPGTIRKWFYIYKHHPAVSHLLPANFEFSGKD